MYTCIYRTRGEKFKSISSNDENIRIRVFTTYLDIRQIYMRFECLILKLCRL